MSTTIVTISIVIVIILVVFYQIYQRWQARIAANALVTISPALPPVETDKKNTQTDTKTQQTDTKTQQTQQPSGPMITIKTGKTASYESNYGKIVKKFTEPGYYLVVSRPNGTGMFDEPEVMMRTSTSTAYDAQPSSHQTAEDPNFTIATAIKISQIYPNESQLTLFVIKPAKPIPDLKEAVELLDKSLATHPMLGEVSFISHTKIIDNKIKTMRSAVAPDIYERKPDHDLFIDVYPPAK